MTLDKESKLPVWARDLIRSLRRERDTAIQTLNEFVDSQTPSRIFVDDLVSTGERQGPSEKRLYVQSDKVSILHAGVMLDVYTCYGPEISLRWWADERRGLATGVGLVPESFCAAKLVHKDNMR